MNKWELIAAGTAEVKYIHVPASVERTRLERLIREDATGVNMDNLVGEVGKKIIS